LLKVRFNWKSFYVKRTNFFCYLLALQQRDETGLNHFKYLFGYCDYLLSIIIFSITLLQVLQSCWNVAISSWRFGMHWIVLGANIKHKFCWRKKYSHSCLSETIYHQIRKKQSSNKKRHIPLAKCKFFFQAKTKKILILFRYKSTTIRPYLEWKKI